MAILDRFDRPLKSLRVSVTDRCNLRCRYCCRRPTTPGCRKTRCSTFEEISTLADAFCDLGVDRVRLTGGEPLLRRDLTTLVGMLAARPAIRDLALTTNGILLAPQAAALRAAGLHRITVSLDTLQRDRFRALTRFDSLSAVLDGIAAAAAADFDALKIDTVVIRGVNDDELVDLIEYRPDDSRRGALHRVHGCRRRYALDIRGRSVPSRHPCRARTPLRRGDRNR